jgi:hypothetical protein
LHLGSENGATVLCLPEREAVSIILVTAVIISSGIPGRLWQHSTTAAHSNPSTSELPRQQCAVCRQKPLEPGRLLSSFPHILHRYGSMTRSQLFLLDARHGSCGSTSRWRSHLDGEPLSRWCALIVQSSSRCGCQIGHVSPDESRGSCYNWRQYPSYKESMYVCLLD